MYLFLSNVAFLENGKQLETALLSLTPPLPPSFYSLSVQKMLLDVNRGETVDTRIVSAAYTFRIAVEGLRISLNSAARLATNKIGNPNSAKIDLSELQLKVKVKGSPK
ncbi:hypothetical protein CJ030_MR2G023223 [Morella rubra]|uniref:Uncharacterized protein n=1 Tax=Morella rubra TaxID=262757 RepID=A0A6A1WGW7_9ROSI|nr:hypothetical protein CJ030_MR2G023223 [Morella rubra]